MGQWGLCVQQGVRGQQGVHRVEISVCRLAMGQVVDRECCIPLEPGGGLFRPQILPGAARCLRNAD